MSSAHLAEMGSLRSHLSDEALVALASQDDELAFAELYDRFSRVAYGLALRVLRDETLAQDAMQEAFLAVWRLAGSYRPERARPSTWILTLVHRRAVDLLRREQRQPTQPLEEALPATGPATDEEAALRAQRQVVRKALRRLTGEQRKTLALAFYGGLTQREIAEQLGQPLGTIKSRMFRGLGRLSELLAEE